MSQKGKSSTKRHKQTEPGEISEGQNSAKICRPSTENILHVSLTSSHGDCAVSGNIAEQFLALEKKLVHQLKALHFSEPVTHIYNPLEYAAEPHKAYVDRYCRSTKAVLFLGMNPGPYGMAQTGVSINYFVLDYSFTANVFCTLRMFFVLSLCVSLCDNISKTLVYLLWTIEMNQWYKSIVYRFKLCQKYSKLKCFHKHVNIGGVCNCKFVEMGSDSISSCLSWQFTIQWHTSLEFILLFAHNLLTDRLKTASGIIY